MSAIIITSLRLLKKIGIWMQEYVTSAVEKAAAMTILCCTIIKVGFTIDMVETILDSRDMDQFPS
jgi:protoheme ferro-lyase